MRGKPTIQAKTAIDGLKAAGFLRNEFSVTTKQLWRDGGKFYEYGDAQISMRCHTSKIVEFTPNLLAQGFHVEYYYWEGLLQMALVNTEYSKQGQLTIHGRKREDQ